MDLRKLKKLIELVEESSIAELEITEGEEKVRISKSGPAMVPNYAFIPSAMQQPILPSTPQTVAVAPITDTNNTLNNSHQIPEGHLVKSPMVGRFYRSASPGANPFVEI